MLLFSRQTAAEEMMATLPEDWKKSRVSNKRRSGGGGFHRGGKRRGGGSGGATSPPAKKKAEENDGKIVITADNPVSCLYEYAKKVH